MSYHAYGDAFDANAACLPVTCAMLNKFCRRDNLIRILLIAHSGHWEDRRSIPDKKSREFTIIIKIYYKTIFKILSSAYTQFGHGLAVSEKIRLLPGTAKADEAL